MEQIHCCITSNPSPQVSMLMVAFQFPKEAEILLALPAQYQENDHHTHDLIGQIYKGIHCWRMGGAQRWRSPHKIASTDITAKANILWVTHIYNIEHHFLYYSQGWRSSGGVEFSNAHIQLIVLCSIFLSNVGWSDASLRAITMMMKWHATQHREWLKDVYWDQNRKKLQSIWNGGGTWILTSGNMCMPKIVSNHVLNRQCSHHYQPEVASKGCRFVHRKNPAKMDEARVEDGVHSLTQSIKNMWEDSSMAFLVLDDDHKEYHTPFLLKKLCWPGQFVICLSFIHQHFFRWCMIRNDYPLSPKRGQSSQALVGIVNLCWFSGYQPLGKPIVLDFMEKLIAVLLENQVIYGCSQDICCHAQRYA